MTTRDALVLIIDDDNDLREALVEQFQLEPGFAGDGAATAFVCRGFTCERPTSDPASLLAMLTGDVVSG